MLIPKNTQYNRRLNLMDCSGRIITIRNGVVYFFIDTVAGGMKYFKCEMELFLKQFETEGEDYEVTGMNTDETDAMVKMCNRYP
jgi:hypothetical protein